MNRIFVRIFLLSFLSVVGFVVFVPSQHDRPVAVVSQQSTSTATSGHVKAGDFAPGQLQAHFMKHGYQFGPISEYDYLEDARKLLDAPVGGDILEKIEEDGDIEHYNHHTHEFAVMTPTGRIRTYFIADEQYWSKQK